MNILPRLALCNHGCSERSAASGSKTMRLVQSVICSFARAESAPTAAAKAASPAFDPAQVLRSVAATVALGLTGALLSGALLSEDYGRGVQMQASGYSALSDKVAGIGAGSAMHDVAETPRVPALPRQTGL